MNSCQSQEEEEVGEVVEVEPLVAEAEPVKGLEEEAGYWLSQYGGHQMVRRHLEGQPLWLADVKNY
jgi:hypothetical protein